MIERKSVTVTNVQGALEWLWPYFNDAVEIHNFHADLTVEGQVIKVDMASSPGGGFEGGYGSTRLSTVLPSKTEFEFVVYPDDFLNKIGKLFGMEDTQLGYPGFDDKLVVKTTNKQLLQNLFAEKEIRETFSTLSGFSLKCHVDHDKQHHLFELEMQRAATNYTEFAKLLSGYMNVYYKIDQRATV